MKNSVRTLLFGAALAACMAASAQYQWIDKDGRRVFSDQPPPPGVPEKNILSRPRGAHIAPTAAPAEQASASGAAQPAASAPSGVDKSLEEKAKQAEEAEAAKKKAEEDKRAADKAENCKRAIANKATYESTPRLFTTDAKGERKFVEDKERAAEVKRLNDIIASDCPK